MSKVWLITGCTSGFGQEIALAALARGDTVVATARDPTKLSTLASQGAITERLDVTDSDDTLSSTIAAIVAKTGGRIDILVNNAGYILSGGVEECSDEEVHSLFDTNVFGQLRVLRAVLPVMRAQRSGVVANLGSVGGWFSHSAAGPYCATKACATLISEALRDEVKHLGIQVTCIEPGYFRTNFLSQGHQVRAKNTIDELSESVDGSMQALRDYDRKQPGDPAKGARLIVEALTGSGRAQGRELPARFVLGSDAYAMIKDSVDADMRAMEAWRDLATATDCDELVGESS